MRKLALVTLFALALALRFAGLSHDLWEGNVYHPDSPKQMLAAQRFLRGDYHIHTGNPDVDGYPYLNSHLVELAYRGFRAPANAVLSWIGVRAELPQVPERIVLHWMTRCLNATLSALTVVAIMVLALESFGPRVAFVAGSLAALSPLDVVACHEANSDSTAAFFAVLAVLFSGRVLASGRKRDYALATFFSVASFAAKYHGAASFFALVVAHVARAGSWRALVGRESWSRMALVFAVGVASLCLTIPPLVTHPVETITDIDAFLRWVARPGRVPLEARGGLVDRFTFSMMRNAPILASALSLPVAVAAIVGIARLRRGAAALAVVYAMPLVYFFVAIAFRPAAPPVNHVVISTLVLLLAVAVVEPWWRTRKHYVRLAAAALLAVSVASLAKTTARELFFYDLHDTRFLAKSWARENAPRTFRAWSKGYGFSWKAEGAGEAEGEIYVADSFRRETPIPPGFQRLKRFTLDSSPLRGFRNPDLDVYISTPLLAPGFTSPILPRLPAQSGNEVVFEGPEPFYRSAKIVALDGASDAWRFVVSPAPLAKALLVLRAGATATRVRASFAGTEADVDLGPEETRIVSVDSLRPGFPRDGAIELYRFDARAAPGPAIVEIATTSLERGLAWFETGRFAEAARALVEASAESRDPAIAALAVVADAAGGANARPRRRLRKRAAQIDAAADRRRIDELYGGTLGYLDRLDYLEGETEELPRRGLVVVDDRDASGGRALAHSRSAELDSGHVHLRIDALASGPYRVRWRLRNGATEPRRLAITLVDRYARRREIAKRMIEPSAGYVEAEASLELAERSVGATLVLEVENGITVDRFGIAPDVAEAVARRAALAGAIEGTDQKVGPDAYDVLLALGRRHAAAGDGARAASRFRSARELRPERASAVEALAALDAKWRSADETRLVKELEASRPARTFHEARARFDDGFELLGYRLEHAAVASDGEIGLNLYFAAPPPAAALNRLAVWIHFVDGEGRTAFQSDRRLSEVLGLVRQPDELHPRFHRVRVPAGVRPGDYRIRVGLWDPTTGKKLKRERSAPFAKRQKGVELGQLVEIRGE